MRAAGGNIPPAASLRRYAGLGLALVLLAGACGDTTSESPAPETSAAATSLTAPPPADVDVQGHRGARGLQPENTLPGFESALDLGVDTLELDLHFTADGHVVVWHDPIVHPDKCRLDPGASVDSPDPAESDPADIAIAGFTRDDLLAYQCDLNPDSSRFPDQQATGAALAGSDYRITTLPELFTFVAAYAESDSKTPDQRAAAAAVRFNIETKRVPDAPANIGDGFDGVNAGAFELAVLAAVATAGLADRVVIQSFDHRSLRAIRGEDPDIALAALTRRDEPFEDRFSEFATIWSPDHRSLSASSLEQAQAAGVQVIPWTVNDTTDMTRLIELGVDGLITDRPDLLIATLNAT